MAEPVALIALAVDAAIGWPDRLYRRIGHPVGGFARLIGWCAKRWNPLAASDAVRRAGGIATLALLLAITISLCVALETASRSLEIAPSWLLIGLMAAPALAQKSLYDHVRAVFDALSVQDIPAARRRVAMIVGRDVDALDEAGIARAAIESLAESYCDGVISPLFWLLLGGLPGIWSCKAVNTADSLIGHREHPWGPFGWAAARTDDVMNWLPARISAIFLCVAGGRGWRVVAADAHRHASPNAGWPEAAMAGALDLRLAGPVRYDGAVHDKCWIGNGRADLHATDVKAALNLYIRACLISWIVTGGVLWLA